MRCHQCGAELPEQARFCPQCAAPVAPAEVSQREERKVVTVLFADLVGFTSRAEQLDPEDVRALLRPLHEQLRTTLERFGGTVEKFIGDAVMALFGAPITHEDDAERAVRAAIAIRDWVRSEERDLQLRIGVNTGEVLVNLDASPARGESMASGDVVNTAARLQTAAAPNGILVGESTHRAASRFIVFRAAPPVSAKGKSEPLPAWEVVDARARVGADAEATASTTMVGRDRELRLMTDALSRAQEDCVAQLVTIVGVPGIGKSRLVGELFGVIERQADIVLWRRGRSLPYGDGITFWALAEMTKAHAGILETDSLEDARSKLHDAVRAAVNDGDEAAWIEEQLKPLAGLDASAVAHATRRAQAFNAWTRFFHLLAEVHPLVMVFEDLHWADDNLLDFIDLLVDASDDVPLLVIATARPEFFERRAGWGGGKRNAVTISLSPLRDEETALLIAELTGRQVMVAEEQQALLARASGNPLFAEQFVRMLGERGDSSVGGGETLPETIQGIIAARIDGLPDDEKAVLQDAAVIGKVFWSGALAEIGAHDADDVGRQLRALQRKDFVQRAARSSVAGEHEYSFLHALMRDVAYGQIPRSGRATRHRRAAAWLAAIGRADDTAEMRAHHLQTAVRLSRAAGETVGAGLVQDTVAALQEAAQRAQALSAPREALRYLEAALELTEPGTLEHGRLLLRSGKVQFIVGGFDGAVLGQAAAELLALNDLDGAAEAEVEYANVCWGRGDRAGADAHIDAAQRLLAQQPPSAVKAKVATEASRMLMLAGRSEEAVRIGQDALAMSRRFGLADLQASGYNNIG
ncbi:MAG: AAA family ATPase, partial [Candidatus Dormibacteraeota bacterium]|nr:AAA family ATPase [Candidatus Dormibacteraeota bacterium]